MVALCAAFLAMKAQDPNAAVRAAIPVSAADSDRPIYHYHAPAQWMNDPNGPVFYKGWYHLFYQLTPDGDRSGIKHWGHARSRDLVRWEDLPIALSPVDGENSIWSGSVFPRPGGISVAFYTSIGAGRDPEQRIATPEDDELISWRRDPVRITQTVNGAKPLTEWRDPFLFEDLGLTFMVIGGGHDGRGVVALYKATEPTLRHWQYLGDCFTHPDANVRNIECPNLVRVDGKWVLLVSVWPHVEAFVGELQNTRFVTESRSVIAEGSYASQIFQGLPDRTIHTAWIPTEHHKGWNGYLTLPSELHIAKDGTLLRTPVKELLKLRGKAVRLADADVDGTFALPSGDSLEINLTIKPEGSKRVGLRLLSGGLSVAYDPATRTLSAGDQSCVVPGSVVKNGLRLRVFVDRTAVDVYAADGAATLVARIDHVSGQENFLFSEEGAARFERIAVYELVLKGQ